MRLLFWTLSCLSSIRTRARSVETPSPVGRRHATGCAAQSGRDQTACGTRGFGRSERALHRNGSQARDPKTFIYLYSYGILDDSKRGWVFGALFYYTFVYSDRALIFKLPLFRVLFLHFGDPSLRFKFSFYILFVILYSQSNQSYICSDKIG